MKEAPLSMKEAPLSDPSRPLRILMALDYYLPYVSGLSVTVERLAEGIAARGHSVTVLTHLHRRDLPREERQGAVRVVRAPVLARIGKAQISPAIVSAARRELARSDVLHLHAPLVPAVPLAFLGRARGVPIVANYHCDLHLPPGIVNRGIEAIARISQDFALDRAAVIINSTEDYARATPSLARRLDRFVGIIPPVPPLPPSPVTPGQLRARWMIEGAPVILFVGRFAEEKGLAHLVSALQGVRKRFPHAVLLLAGENRDIPGETVGRRLAPLLADPRSGVVATGHVPDSDMGALFALADVLALPSTNSTESFGMIQVEAMKAGLPVVASDLPGVREPIRATGMGELALPGDPASLAAALVRVLAAPSDYRSRAGAAQLQFSVDRTLSEYEDAYRRARASAGAGKV
jgi:glycosyltransferase involved in cell wall biosynthesis